MSGRILAVSTTGMLALMMGLAALLAVAGTAQAEERTCRGTIGSPDGDPRPAGGCWGVSTAGVRALMMGLAALLAVAGTAQAEERTCRGTIGSATVDNL